MTVQDSDKFLVSRSSSSYHVEAQNLMAELKDDDLMLVNRQVDGVQRSFKATGLEIKDSLKAPADIDKPEILAPADGAGIGGDVTYTPKTSEITDVQNVDGAWTPVTPSIFNSDTWSLVGYGDGKFVAAIARSSADNTFVYSSDGISWTASPSTTKNGVSGIVYGFDRFVTVGGGNDGFYSEDGITWIKTTSPVKFLNSVCYGDGKYVAVGNSSSGGANDYCYSSEGINWTAGSITAVMIGIA